MTLPDQANEEYRQGNRLLVGRSHAAALEVFRRVIDQAPRDPDGYIGAAKALLALDRYEEAVGLLSPVAEELASGQLLSVLAGSCRILAFRGNAAMVDSALRYYSLYHLLRVDSISLFYEGEMHQKKRDYEAAYRSFLQAWELDPRDRRAYTNALFCLRKLGREDDAIALKARWASAKVKSRGV